jgi:nucleobase:cation symporter-1, NCS1 family
MFYFWGYSSAFLVYSLLSYFFPAPETIIPATIFDDTDVISAADEKADSDGPEDKKALEVEQSAMPPV